MTEATSHNDRAQPPALSLPRRLWHWGPFVALSIVAIVSTATFICLMEWWPPFSSVYAAINVSGFIASIYLTLSNFFVAAELGPGYVPLGWKPDNPADEESLQFCAVCEGFKAPRSHHCRKCNRCVMKMDHHCPWINNCTGHFNHGFFVRFLFWAVVGCAHGAFILAPSIYRAIFRVWYLYYGTGREPIVNLSVYGILYAIFAFGLAVGVVVAVGFLMFVQLRVAYRNRTAIEDWILTKAKYRARDPKETGTFTYPYNLGWRANLRQVFTWSGHVLGDGFTYPVIDNCDQYTLTREQLRQKDIKRQHLVDYLIQTPYSGSLIPLSYGMKVAFCLPFTDEPRLPVSNGDVVRISRWKRHWMYGEKVVKDSMNGIGDGEAYYRARGWLPRRCGVKVKQNECDLPKMHAKAD